MTDPADGRLDPGRFRALTIEACGFDPGPLEPATRLADVGLTGFDRLRLTVALEDEHGIAFPADLMAAVETVDDLTYYTRVKLEQRNPETLGPTGGK